MRKQASKETQHCDSSRIQHFNVAGPALLALRQDLTLFAVREYNLMTLLFSNSFCVGLWSYALLMVKLAAAVYGCRWVVHSASKTLIGA